MDETIRIWDVQTGECIQTLRDHTHWFNCVTWSSDGKYLASASDDNTVRIWNLKPLLTLIENISLNKILTLHALQRDTLALKNPHINQILERPSPKLQKGAPTSFSARLTTWQKVGIGLGATVATGALGYLAWTHSGHIKDNVSTNFS